VPQPRPAWPEFPWRRAEREPQSWARGPRPEPEQPKPVPAAPMRSSGAYRRCRCTAAASCCRQGGTGRCGKGSPPARQASQSGCNATDHRVSSRRKRRWRSRCDDCRTTTCLPLPLRDRTAPSGYCCPPSGANAGCARTRCSSPGQPDSSGCTPSRRRRAWSGSRAAGLRGPLEDTSNRFQPGIWWKQRRARKLRQTLPPGTHAYAPLPPLLRPQTLKTCATLSARGL